VGIRSLAGLNVTLVARALAVSDIPWLKFLAVLFYVAMATLFAAWLNYQLGVPRVGMIFLLCVVLVSYVQGARFGLFSAVLATLSYDYFIGSPHLAIDLGAKQNVFNIVVFMAAALLTGTYTERMRERHAAMLAVREASSIGGDDNVRRVQRATHGDDIAHVILGEALRALFAVLLSVAGILLAMAFHAWFGIQYVSAIVLGTVVLIAGFLGIRPGLLAAVFCVFAFDYMFVGPPYQLDLASPQDLVNFALFAGVGWAVGAWVERLRNQQQIIRWFLGAERGLFAAGDETAIRSSLQRAVEELLGTKPVWVLTETAKPSDLSFDRASPGGLTELLAKLAPRQTAEAGPWRVRLLGNDKENFGSIIWLSLSRNVIPLRYRDWAVSLLADLASVAISQARTNTHKLEADLAARSDRLGNALLSSVSHDFRTPLSGILGSVTALIEQGDLHGKAQRDAFLVNIKTQVTRLNRYVENLLGIMRVDSGTLQVHRAQVMLEPLVYDAWDALSDAGADNRVLRVERSFSHAMVLADSTLASHALQNVLENAIKFSPELSVVYVRSRGVGGRIELEIIDEGGGVEPADLPFIFERFYRSKAASAAGTGLGLFIARGMLEAMDAHVDAMPRKDGKTGLCVLISFKAGENSP
jgi:two-component system sensor histidine kinase KdpD